VTTPTPDLKFLAKARVGHLGTAARSGIPLVVPVCFVYNGTTVYSVIDQKPKRKKPLDLRRVLNILENPNACLVVDKYYEDWRRLRYVIVQGRASVLTRGKERRTALSLLKKKYRQYVPMDLAGRPVIRIQPLRIVAWKSARVSRTVKPKEYD
jgi:PPOX class probable F420-dependent enzyme